MSQEPRAPTTNAQAQSEPVPKRTWQEKLWTFLNRRRNGLLVASALFFLTAVSLENPWVTAVAHGRDYSLVINWAFWVKLFLELGYALFIAWIVATFIEYDARQRDQTLAEQLRHQIKEDVFVAVFARAFGDKYTTMVNDRALRADLVREYMEVDYRIEPLPKEIADEIGEGHTRFVMLYSSSRYRFRNVSSKERSFDLFYRYSIRAGKLKKHNKVTHLEVKGDERTRYSDAEIEAMTEPQDDFYNTCNYSIRLKPGECADIFLDNELVKEQSDNEIWGSFHPTMRVRLTARSHVPGTIIGVRAVTGSPLERVFLKKERNHGEWTIDVPMLPHDSLVLWWRTEEDDSGGAEVDVLSPQGQENLGPPETVG